MFQKRKLLKTDPEQITLIGDSAGGILAASVSLMARDRGEFSPRRQILIYPCLNNDYSDLTPYESVRENGQDYLLTQRDMMDYQELYQSSVEDRKNLILPRFCQRIGIASAHARDSDRGV